MTSFTPSIARLLSGRRWRDLAYCLVVLAFVFDLVFLQHGRLGSESGVSVRQLVFLLLMMLALINPGRLRSLRPDICLGLLLLGLVIPAVWGWLGIEAGHPLGLVVNDANGHVFYLVGFALLLGYRTDFSPDGLQRLFMALTALLCLICLAAYGYSLTGLDRANRVEAFLREGDYGFLNVFRDGRPYRFFLSSFVFVPILTGFALYALLSSWRDERRFASMAALGLLLGFATLMMAQTRSLWLGFIVSTAVVFLYCLRGWRIWLAAGGGLMFGGIAMVLLVPDLLRLADVDGNMDFRVVQAAELVRLFLLQPVFGAGFGAVADLSALTGRPPGFSHEMDLIDLVRKIGLVGAGVYLLALLSLARPAWQLFRQQAGHPAPCQWLVSLGVVFTVGFFNPYATASLGIGAIVIATVSVAFSLEACKLSGTGSRAGES
jgi:hypothetical protein